MKRILWSLLMIFFMAQSALAGRIILANDEWTLSDRGFSKSADAATFANNIAAMFAPDTGTANFLAYSSNFGLTGTQLASVMTAAGTWTVDTFAGTNITLEFLLNYDGLFLAHDAVFTGESDLLTEYVNAGGNVYLAGGTGGFGGASIEAKLWNPFLNNFGLALDPASYNGVIGNIDIYSSHPLFAGVSELYQNNGNDTLETKAFGAYTEIMASYNGHGLYAIYDGPDSSAPVPEPCTLILLSTALMVAGGLKKWQHPI